MLEFLSKYEESHKNPPAGQPFSEIYNVDILEPTNEWLDKYHTVSDAIVKIGLDINNRWKDVKKTA